MASWVCLRSRGSITVKEGRGRPHVSAGQNRLATSADPEASAANQRADEPSRHEPFERVPAVREGEEGMTHSPSYRLDRGLSAMTTLREIQDGSVVPSAQGTGSR